MARPEARISSLLDGAEVKGVSIDNDKDLMALFGDIPSRDNRTDVSKSQSEMAEESQPMQTDNSPVSQTETIWAVMSEAQTPEPDPVVPEPRSKEEPGLEPVNQERQRRQPMPVWEEHTEKPKDRQYYGDNPYVQADPVKDKTPEPYILRQPQRSDYESHDIGQPDLDNRPYLSQAMQTREERKSNIHPEPSGYQGQGVVSGQVQRSYSYKSLSKPEASYKSYKKQVVAIHSPKGGVGKTTITKELAFGFGSAIVNNEPLKILVIDGDWEFGNISIQFDIAPVPNIAEWVRVMRRDREIGGKIPLYCREEIDDRYLIHYNENIDILAGSPNSMDSQLIDSEIVAAIIDNLRKVGNYDFILIDNANSLKDTTIIPLMKADTVILVETLDTTTIQDTKNMLDTLRSLQFDYSKIRMVLNNVPEDDSKLDIAVAEIPRVLRLELAAVVPAYDHIRLYNNSGEAAILDKETSFSREIKKLANNIMPVFDTKPKGFLSRLFSKFRKGR